MTQSLCTTCPHFSCSERVACCNKHQLRLHYQTPWEFRWLRCPDTTPNATLTWDPTKGDNPHAQ